MVLNDVFLKFGMMKLKWGTVQASPAVPCPGEPTLQSDGR